VDAAQGVALEAPRVVERGGVKIGVFGLADPASLAAYDVKASDPTAAARATVAALRKDGAQVIVALTQLDRADAKKLAQAKLGIDFIVVGRDAPDPTGPGGVGPGILASNDAYLILPTQRGQSVVRVELHLDRAAAARSAIVDAIGDDRARDRIAELEASATKLEKDLAGWKADPTADAKFVADQEKILADLKAQRDELAKNPVRKPAQGSWLTAAHVLIQRKLRCDKDVVAAKRAFDKAAAAKNLAAAAGEEPAPVPAGGAGYVGIEECGFCHKAAVDFWKDTHHAQAWETLEKVGKEVNRDCISCHVTGWGKPGGAVLAKNEHLRDVQCEVCHGPGSKHVDAAKADRKTTIVRLPVESTCKECHSKEHSDTFDFTPYLRDVTGKGHGEAFRKSLGDGPTGFALRSAALARAAQAIGEGCDK
jgi:hypothetical protein